MSSTRKSADAHGVQRAKGSAQSNHDLTKDPIVTIIDDLKFITFKDSQNSGDTIKVLAETMEASIRPGDGLLGTAAEEDDLYRRMREEFAAREEAEKEIKSEHFDVKVEEVPQEDRIDSHDLVDDKPDINRGTRIALS